MNIYFFSLVLLSTGFSAQISQEKKPTTDSSGIQKIEIPHYLDSLRVPYSIDTTIAKIYKMPNAVPKNPELYTILKSPIKTVSIYKNRNLLIPPKAPKTISK